MLPEHAQKDRLQAVIGMLQEGFGGLIGQHTARLQQNNPAAERLCLFKVVRGQHDRMALFIEPTDKGPKALAKFNINARGWLI